MIEDYAQVEEDENLIRDMSSNAIVNTNSSALARAKAMKLEADRKRLEQEQLRTDVDTLKQDMGDIKDMLTQLLNRN